MNLQLTSATAAARKQARNQRLGALGGLALALALAAGIGVWYTAGQRDATSAQPTAAAPAPAGDAPGVSARSSEGSVVYIVRSQEDVELIQRFATELGGSASEVVVIDYDAATVVLAIPGASDKAFVDLRAR
jgi:hypothetical protein